MTKTEFTSADLERIDAVYEATFQYCRFLADAPGMECDISVLGPVADAAAEILKEHGISAWFPYEDENGKICTHF